MKHPGLLGLLLGGLVLISGSARGTAGQRATGIQGRRVVLGTPLLSISPVLLLPLPGRLLLLGLGAPFYQRRHLFLELLLEL